MLSKGLPSFGHLNSVIVQTLAGPWKHPAWTRSRKLQEGRTMIRLSPRIFQPPPAYACSLWEVCLFPEVPQNQDDPVSQGVVLAWVMVPAPQPPHWVCAQTLMWPGNFLLISSSSSHAVKSDAPWGSFPKILGYQPREAKARWSRKGLHQGLGCVRVCSQGTFFSVFLDDLQFIFLFIM